MSEVPLQMEGVGLRTVEKAAARGVGRDSVFGRRVRVLGVGFRIQRLGIVG